MIRTAHHLRYAFTALVATALLLPACKDDDTDPREEANDRLDGDWEVSSFTQDGSERIGFTITSFEMEFDKDDPYEGETEWTFIFSDGSTQRLEGDYEIEDDGNGIDIDGDELDLEIDGDELEISGPVNGVRWEIEAERD